ncbi:MAG: hypothetical protein KatS3mg060_2063 [Dehalococcoidia bacterium]|nr:MAG: hypothetical protein KatS3mg060_2063 [Dehalococcoidia bacterium]
MPPPREELESALGRCAPRRHHAPRARGLRSAAVRRSALSAFSTASPSSRPIRAADPDCASGGAVDRRPGVGRYPSNRSPLRLRPGARRRKFAETARGRPSRLGALTLPRAVCRSVRLAERPEALDRRPLAYRRDGRRRWRRRRVRPRGDRALPFAGASTGWRWAGPARSPVSEAGSALLTLAPRLLPGTLAVPSFRARIAQAFAPAGRPRVACRPAKEIRWRRRRPRRCAGVAKIPMASPAAAGMPALR